MPMQKGLIIAGLLGLLILTTGDSQGVPPVSPRFEAARHRVTPELTQALAARNLTMGAPIFIRIFKQDQLLELFIESGDRFELFKTYPICTYSGRLGPKTRQGDMQAPEGFYFVGPDRLNPWSSYHLSFNLGYPNAYERSHGWTGGALMVHGDCVSIGCYAMGDAGIEEIYTLADAALRNGQPFFRVHVFPFRLTPERLEMNKDSRWYEFWSNLRTGYDWFETRGVPPDVYVAAGEYRFR